MSLSVFEIRNYVLQPNLREHFIDYFEANFITTQAAVGMAVLGQFRLLGEPDHYVWIRAYETMQTRGESLHAFYDGPVWKQHRSRTNGMLIDSDNVHLLRPLDSSVDLTGGQTAQTVAAALADASLSPDTGLVGVDFYQAAAGHRDDLISRFQDLVAPAYQKVHIQLRGCFVAEMGQNTFPRHPAFQNADEFVVITAYVSEAAAQNQRGQVAPVVDQATHHLLSAPVETLMLSPTLRSPLRYQPVS